MLPPDPFRHGGIDIGKQASCKVFAGVPEHVAGRAIGIAYPPVGIDLEHRAPRVIHCELGQPQLPLSLPALRDVARGRYHIGDVSLVVVDRVQGEIHGPHSTVAIEDKHVKTGCMPLSGGPYRIAQTLPALV